MVTFDKCKSFMGELIIPGDKSITHRAIIVGAMAKGQTVIVNPLFSRDTLTTVCALRSLGVDINDDISKIIVDSKGYKKLQEPTKAIDCNNSGTTIRLLMGLLSASNLYSVLVGDNSLSNRPMDRVIEPLSKLGADIRGRDLDRLLPITILPSKMNAGLIESEVKSAQVKGALLLAGAILNGESKYIERVETRDHTERMLKTFGADIVKTEQNIVINGGKDLISKNNIVIPGDFSSAAFFIVAGLIFEDSEVLIKNCGLNSTRIGFLKALKILGVNIETELLYNDNVEEVGNIYIKYQEIEGGLISGNLLANMIDEVPALALIGLFSKAPIEIRDAKELRIKETDRIKALVTNFRTLGAEVEEFDDGLKIYPLKSIPNKVILKSFRDHRISMINILLAKKFGVNIIIDEISHLNVSYPNFIDDITILEKS